MKIARLSSSPTAIWLCGEKMILLVHQSPLPSRHHLLFIKFRNCVLIVTNIFPLLNLQGKATHYSAKPMFPLQLYMIENPNYVNISSKDSITVQEQDTRRNLVYSFTNILSLHEGRSKPEKNGSVKGCVSSQGLDNNGC